MLSIVDVSRVVLRAEGGVIGMPLNMYSEVYQFLVNSGYALRLGCPAFPVYQLTPKGMQLQEVLKETAVSRQYWI